MIVLRAAVVGIDNAIVMIRELEVTFRGNSVASRRGIACQRHVSVEYLLSSSANLYVRSVAFEVVVFRRSMPFSIATGARTSGIGSVFHGTCDNWLQSAPGLRLVSTTTHPARPKRKFQSGVSVLGAGGLPCLLATDPRDPKRPP